MGTRNVNGIEVSTMSIPAPVTREYWVASEKEYDLGRPIGYGISEQAAIDDLFEQLEERA